MTVAASRAMPDDDGRLGLAVTLAQEAGRHVMVWRADSAVAWKAPGERVSDADVRAIGILPVGAARYEAAPTPVLASNPSTHELAATACRAALAAQPVADRPSGDSPTAE